MFIPIARSTASSSPVDNAQVASVGFGAIIAFFFLVVIVAGTLGYAFHKLQKICRKMSTALMNAARKLYTPSTAPVSDVDDAEKGLHPAPASPTASTYCPSEADSDDVSEVATPPQQFVALADVAIHDDEDVHKISHEHSTVSEDKVCGSNAAPHDDEHAIALCLSGMFGAALSSTSSLTESTCDSLSSLATASSEEQLAFSPAWDIGAASPLAPHKRASGAISVASALVASASIQSAYADASISSAASVRNFFDDEDDERDSPSEGRISADASAHHLSHDNTATTSHAARANAPARPPRRPTCPIASSPSLDAALTIAALRNPTVTAPPTVERTRVGAASVVVVSPHVIDAPLLLLTSPTLPDFDTPNVPDADTALLCDRDAQRPRRAPRRRREAAAPAPRAPRGWLEETCARFMLEEADRIAELA